MARLRAEYPDIRLSLSAWAASIASSREADVAGDTYGRGTGDEGCGTTVDGWPSADGMPSESDPAALAAPTSPVSREGEAGSTRIGVAGAADGCRPSEPLCSDSAKSWALRCRAAGSEYECARPP